ncbi:MAG: acyloxyacyl hydrolase [Arhodomonas sp.]|nr:acyloxyacyl hydrolase [Arhodomonas sp.]
MNRSRATLWASATLGIGLLATSATAAPTADAEVGVRVGGNNESVEATAVTLMLPAAGLQRLLEDWLPDGTEANWEISAGRWQGYGDEAAFIAAGPVLRYPFRDTPLALRLGIQPTVMSDFDAEGKDLGGPVQFTSHLGLEWSVGGGLITSVRIQHTSNAGLFDENPGVNLLAIGLSRQFSSENPLNPARGVLRRPLPGTGRCRGSAGAGRVRHQSATRWACSPPLSQYSRNTASLPGACTQPIYRTIIALHSGGLTACANPSHGYIADEGHNPAVTRCPVPRRHLRRDLRLEIPAGATHG